MTTIDANTVGVPFLCLAWGRLYGRLPDDGYQWSKYRENSSTDAAYDLIEKFLDQISQLHEDYMCQFPNYFFDALETLEADLLEKDMINNAKDLFSVPLLRWLFFYCYIQLI